MAAPKSQRDNADAFDDLLGQLVDELAMTPTMVPEPEPEPEPEPPPPAPIQEVYHAPVQEAPPPRSNMMPIAIGGGIAVAGIALALVLGRGDPPKPAEPAKPVVEAKKDVAAPVAVQPPPGQPVVAQPGVVNAAGTPAVPGVAGTPGVPGTPGVAPLPGQPGQPGDPVAAVPGTPGTEPPVADTPAKPTKKPVKKPTTGGGGTKKPEPKKKPGEVVDPFG